MNLGELKATLSIDKGSIDVATANVKSALGKSGTDAGNAIAEWIIDWAKKGASGAEKEFKKVASSLESAWNAFKTFIQAIGVLWVIDKVKQLWGAIVELGSNLEQSRIAFTTMLWSVEKADKLLRDLSEFSKKTPFELVGIRENAKQLLAMGVAQENIIPTLKALGDVASGLSVPLERLTLAYGQVLAKWKLTGDDLRQFTEAGVPLLEVLSQQLWKSTAEIQKMIEKGQISAVEVTKAFNTMSSEGGKFANLMDAQSKTLWGLWSNLKDIFTGLGEQIGTSLVPRLSNAVRAITEFVTKNGKQIADFVTATVTGILDLLQWLFNVIGVITSTFSKVSDAFDSFIGVSSDAQKEAGLLSDAMKGNSDAMVDLRNRFDEGLISEEEYRKWMSDLLGQHEQLTLAIEQTKNGAYDYKTAIEKLAATQYKANTAEYLRERAEIVKNINASIALLKAKQALGIQKAKEEQSAKPVTGEGSTMPENKLPKWYGQVPLDLSKLSGVSGGLTVGTAPVSSKMISSLLPTSAEDKQIKELEDSLKNIDKTVASIRSSWGLIDGSEIKDGANSTSTSSAKASKAATEEQTRSVNKLKDSYSDLKSKIRDSEKAGEEYSKATQKLNRDIADSLREVGKQMDENEKKRSDALAKTAEEAKTKKTWSTEDYVRDQAVKQVELAKDVAEIQADIENRKTEAAKKSETVRGDLLEKQKSLQEDLSVAELRRAAFTSGTAEATRKENEFRIASLKSQLEEIKNGSGLSETDKTLLDLQGKLLEKQNALADVKSNLKNLTDSEAVGADALKTKVSEILDVETKRAAMSEQKRAEFDFKQKLAEIDQEKAKKDAEAEADFQREKTKLDRQSKIYEFFQKNKDLTARQLKLIQDGEDFKTASKEEQDLILKLGRERMEITTKKNQKIAAEQEVADATTALSDKVTATLRANVIALKAEYADLIKEIRAAVDAQRALSGTGTGSAKRGFSAGGYTGDGAISEVAGMVHRGEYVVPNHVLQSIPSLIPQLEAARSGRNVDNSRNVSITGPITVNREMDFQLLLDRAKFRM